MAEKISSFRDLRVYQKAFQLQQAIFEITKEFPAEEKYSLTDQIRRSSRSIGANISEAWLPAPPPARKTRAYESERRAYSSESRRDFILLIL